MIFTILFFLLCRREARLYTWTASWRENHLCWNGLCKQSRFLTEKTLVWKRRKNHNSWWEKSWKAQLHKFTRFLSQKTLAFKWSLQAVAAAIDHVQRGGTTAQDPAITAPAVVVSQKKPTNTTRHLLSFQYGVYRGAEAIKSIASINAIKHTVGVKTSHTHIAIKTWTNPFKDQLYIERYRTVHLNQPKTPIG